MKAILCDNCGQPVGDPITYWRLEMKNWTSTDKLRGERDFCTAKCAVKWLNTNVGDGS